MKYNGISYFLDTLTGLEATCPVNLFGEPHSTSKIDGSFDRELPVASNAKANANKMSEN